MTDETKLGPAQSPDLPSAETMLNYANFLEKPKFDVRNGVKYPLPNGEATEAAIKALRYCAELSRVTSTDTTWQPIETAPRDGTKVDLWLTSPQGALTGGDYGRVSDCWFSEGKWWLYDETKYASDQANCRSEVWNVTHWMPRPAAPGRVSQTSRVEPDLCPGGVDPGWDECPKCGATMDDECRGSLQDRVSE